MNSSKPIVAINEAAHAALQAAASQAGKTGTKTSEFWVTVFGTAAAAAAGILLANPIGAAVAGAIGVATAAYTISRGNVKQALGAGAMAALGQVAQVSGPLGEAAKVAEIAAEAAGVAGATQAAPK